jgi:hypothetical protein
MNDHSLESMRSRRIRLTSALRGTLLSAESIAGALLSLSVHAAVLLTVAAVASAAPIGPASAGETAAQNQTVAVVSGNYVEGVPIYRLPRMSVVASRPTELVKNESKAQAARIRDAQTERQPGAGAS